MRLASKLGVICAILLAHSGLLAQSGKQQHAHLSLLSEHSNLTPGQPQWLGIRFDLDPGWHIYWLNPGDSGEPPKATWNLPTGMQVGNLQFPTPQRISDHSLMDYGYEGSTILLAKLTPGPSDTSKAAEIAGDVRYLVCREVCVPGKDHVSLMLPVSNGVKAASAGSQIETAIKRLPQRLPVGIHANAMLSHDLFVVTIVSKGQELGTITDFIPADEQVIENNAKPVIGSNGNSALIKLKKSDQLDHPISQLRGLLIIGDRAYNISIPVSSARTNAHAQTGSR